MAATLFNQMLLNVTEYLPHACLELGLTCLGLLAALFLALDLRVGMMMPGAKKGNAVKCDATSDRAPVTDFDVIRMCSGSTSAGSDSTRSEPVSPRSSCDSSCDDEGSQDATSYHGPLDELVTVGDQRGAWRLVTEMQVSGAIPNGTTCAILLKAKPESIESVSRVLLLADAMEEPMNDMFFIALAEACIRVGRLDFLSKQIEKLQRQGLSACLSADTYDTMIKAYGSAHDMKRVWCLWKQMRSHHVPLTSAVLSHMIETLVSNGQTTEAWRLVQDLQSEDATKTLLNDDMYSNILRGFASAQQTEKAMKLYREMKACQIHPTKVAFDALLSAFAQKGTMQEVPALMDDMKEATALEPDVVTYTTLVKGFCNAGSLDRALKIFKGMQLKEECSPGEVVYNELLGSCVKESRPDEALELLGEMRQTNVPPASHNLGQLVKLLARCRRLDEAFQMLEEIKGEFGVRIDLQVYNRLIQGCFQNGQPNKALAVYDKINREGPPFPDSMTYTALVRGLARMGILDKAAELVRCAYGIGADDHAIQGLDAGVLDEVVVALGGAHSERGEALLTELRGRLPVRGSLDQSGETIQWSSGDVWRRASRPSEV